MKKILLFTTFIFISGLFLANAQTGTYQQMFPGTYTLNDIDGYQLLSTEQFMFNTDIFGDFGMNTTESDSVSESMTDFEFNGNQFTTITSSWIDEDWMMDLKLESYIRSGMQIQVDSTLMFMYDTVSNDWKKNTKIINYFDGDKQTGAETLSADSLTGEWEAVSQTEYTYDSGFLSSELMQSYSADSGRFINSTKTEYFRTSEGRLDSTKRYYWIPEDEDWMTINKTDFFYNDDDNIDYQINYSLNVFTQGWNKSNKTTYLFNSAGNQIRQARFSWNEALSVWSPQSMDSIMYANGVRPLVQITYQDPLFLGTDLLLRSKTYFNYQQVSGIVNNSKSDKISVYPNPTTDFINIRARQLKNGSIQLYDLKGKLIMNKPLVTETTTLSVRNLIRGSYFVRINLGNKTYSRIVMVR